MPVDSPRRSLRIMEQLRNSPAIRSAMKRTNKNGAPIDSKKGIVIDKITVAKGGTDPPTSSSTIEQGYDSLEASSKTGDVLKENLVKMASTTNSTQTKSGKEFSVLIHAHEQKIKQEILVGSNTHEAEPPAGSQKVLGIKKYPSVSILDDHPLLHGRVRVPVLQKTHVLYK